MLVREAKKEELEVIAALEAQNFSDAWSLRALEETYGQKQASILVALTKLGVAGYCIVYTVLDETEIARIATDQAQRRMGVGSALIQYLIEKARRTMGSRILLDVRESNLPARAFYETQGFLEDGIRRNYYDTPREDAVLMSYRVL